MEMNQLLARNSNSASSHYSVADYFPTTQHSQVFYSLHEGQAICQKNSPSAVLFSIPPPPTTFSSLSQSLLFLCHPRKQPANYSYRILQVLIRDKWGPGRERELTVGWIISPFLIKWLKKSQHIKGKRAPGSPAFSLYGREVNKTVKPPQSSRARIRRQKNSEFSRMWPSWDRIGLKAS